MANRMTQSQRTHRYRRDFVLSRVDIRKESGPEATPITASSSMDYCSDEDSDDPYGPQPVKFMQTKEQKQRDAKDLEMRRHLYTIRRMKRARRGEPQRINLPCGSRRTIRRESPRRKQRQMKDPFKALPYDIVVNIMRHTRCDDFENLMVVSPAAEDVYSVNTNTCMKGIEDEQFCQLKWLFGDSRRRNSHQKQNLKDWIGSYSKDFGYQMVHDFKYIDDDNFTGPQLLLCLQWAQESLDVDITAVEMKVGIKMNQRTSLCLQVLSSRRAEVIEFEDSQGYTRKQVLLSRMSAEDRISFFQSQPISTQADIRSIFEKVITHCARASMNWRMALWVRDYYNQRPLENSRGLNMMGTWLTRIAVGLVMQMMLENPAESMEKLVELCWDDVPGLGLPNFPTVLGHEMESYGSGDEDIRTGLDIAEGVGISMANVLPGTAAERTLNAMLEKEAERLRIAKNETPHIPGVYRVVDCPRTLR